MLGCVKLPARQQHLYLVLEDWEKGYSIHRLGEEDFASGRVLDARPAKRPLVSIQAQHTFWCSFAAHGTKILAMQPAGFSPGILVFDTETLEMAVYPRPKLRSSLQRKSVYSSVGNRLVSFFFNSLEGLTGPEPPTTGEPWSWTSAEQPPPFHSHSVSSYAVHPDGRTIFMSFDSYFEKLDKRNSTTSTFSFDTERLEWSRLGDWLLPFRGQAHYDRELDAWVGICRLERGAGRLCCCDVPPAAGARCKTMSMPAWKLGKDVFFDEVCSSSSIGHTGATLIYMGDGRFCLLHRPRLLPEDFDDSDDPRRHVLTITSFGLKYDKVDELVTIQDRSSASISYQTADSLLGLGQDPVAFWM